MKNYINPWNICVIILVIYTGIAVYANRIMGFLAEFGQTEYMLLTVLSIGIPMGIFLMINEKLYIKKVNEALAIEDPLERIVQVKELLNSITVRVDDGQISKKLIEPKVRLYKEFASYYMSENNLSTAMDYLDYTAPLTSRLKEINSNSPTLDIREECDVLAVICLCRIGETASAERKFESLSKRIQFLDAENRTIVENLKNEIEKSKGCCENA